jgi:hypothetical protein
MASARAQDGRKGQRLAETNTTKQASPQRRRVVRRGSRAAREEPGTKERTGCGDGVGFGRASGSKTAERIPVNTKLHSQLFILCPTWMKEETRHMPGAVKLTAPATRI